MSHILRHHDQIIMDVNSHASINGIGGKHHRGTGGVSSRCVQKTFQLRGKTGRTSVVTPDAAQSGKYVCG